MNGERGAFRYERNLYGGLSSRLHLWDVADRDAISVKALQIHQPAREEVAYADGSDLAFFVEFPHRSP